MTVQSPAGSASDLPRLCYVEAMGKRRSLGALGLFVGVTCLFACSRPSEGEDSGPPAPSDSGETGPLTSGGDGAAPEYLYFSNCPYSPLPHCSPTNPVVTDTRGTLCADLGIRQGDRCGPGDPSCVQTRGLRDGPGPDGGVVDSGPLGPCVLQTEWLTCLQAGNRSVWCGSSSASVKKQIEYLTPAEVSEAAREIRDLPLVRYRYKSQGDGVTPTVGIVIEDVPGASFVDRENQRVNLYSFVSATAAAYQAQAKELDELKARLAAVEAVWGRGGSKDAACRPGRACREAAGAATMKRRCW